MFSQQADKRAYQAEWADLGDVRSLRQPGADPRSLGHTARRHLGRHAAPLYGTVVDGVAYTGCYRVLLEHGQAPLPCVLGGLGSFAPVGARPAASLVLGTGVWVVIHPQLSYGVIVACEPGWLVEPTRAWSPQVHQASRCGLRVDSYHHATFRLEGRGGAVDWSAGRPFDGLLIGEQGFVAETGVRLTVDPFMAALAADEATGVWAFYDDATLRLAGVNLQQSTGGSEEEWLVDQGEVALYRGWTPYPWEQCGALKPGGDPFRDLEAQAAQIDEPHYTAVEPVTDDQRPFHRVVELGGYLGQAGRRMVLLPPDGPDRNRYGGPPPRAAFEEFTTLAGAHVVRTAKSLFLLKRPAIPGPARLRRPEDRDGDNEKNYRFAGLEGGGDEHRVAAAVASADALQALDGALDAVAYLCNWEGVHPLHYHKKDWGLGEEPDTKVGTNQAPPRFADLAGGYALGRPDPAYMHVDHRYGDVAYYPNESYFGLLDDGGMAQGDGFWSERRSAGGHIWETAAGDIHLKAGRNLILWAGGDVIIRGRKSVEVVATERNVRIKAERNCQILGGNDDSVGAVLIESRGPAAYDYKDKTGDDVAAGGVHIKAKNGEFAALARAVYLRTGGGDVGAGPITLDAGRGTQGIYAYARDFNRFLASTAADYFGTEGNVQAANVAAASANTFGAGIVAGGTCEITRGGLIVRGNVDVADGHVATSMSDQYHGLLGVLKGQPLADVEAGLDAGDDALKAEAKAGASAWAAAFAAYWYGADRPGEDDTIRAIAFSFRTSEQCRVPGFELHEDRWQRAARLAGGAPEVWTERPVAAGAESTYPFPGRTLWAESPTYRLQDLSLYDQAQGVARPRSDDAYKDPKLPDPATAPPDGLYAVIP